MSSIPVNTTTPPVNWIPPVRTYISSAITYDENIGYTYEDSKMWCFPISMRYLLNSQLANSAYTDSWLYYKIDLIASGTSTPEVRDYCHSGYTQWSSKNDYYVGDRVTYNTLDYECIKDTDRDENPSNREYWTYIYDNDEIYMPIGSAIYEGQTENTWALLNSGGTVLNDNVHRNGLVWHHASGPVYYSISRAATPQPAQLNKESFYVYRKTKCDYYARWQLFWLSPNGGFDTYTFDRKVDINYTTERTTYKQRTPVGSSTDYDSYFGGEKIFNINTTEEFTLRTNLLTQKESQMIIQLFNSPKVYLLKQYNYDTADPNSLYNYGIPLLVTSSELKYEQKLNTKEIYYEIRVKSANQKIIQQS